MRGASLRNILCPSYSDVREQVSFASLFFFSGSGPVSASISFMHSTIRLIAFAWIRFNVRSDLPFMTPHSFSYSAIVFAQSRPSIKWVWIRKRSSRGKSLSQLSTWLRYNENCEHACVMIVWAVNEMSCCRRAPSSISIFTYVWR